MEKNRLPYNFDAEDRRQYKRFPFVFPIKYTYLGKNLEEQKPSEFSLYSFSNNISRGGMMLIISNNVPSGEYIDLVITLPIEHEAVSVNVTGQVMWIQKEDDGYLAGIRFKNVKDDDLAIIQKLLNTDIF